MRAMARILGTLLVGMAALFATAACSGENSDTRCTSQSCTITFDRGASAKAEVLGVEIALVDVQGNTVNLDVAGQRVSLPADGEQQAGAYTLSVDKITEKEVKIKISLT